MTTNERLIILSTTPVKDSALVLHTLSSSWGRRSFITSLRKGGSTALFQPLNIVDADITYNPHSDLWRATSVVLAHPLNGIRGSIPKNAITLFLSEVLFRTIRDGALEGKLFEWVERSILTLDALQSDYSNFHLLWLLQFSAALGFAPTREDIAPFAGTLMSRASALITTPQAEALLIPFSGEERNALCEVFIKYISHHTECSLDIRSLRVLRELFDYA